MDVEDVSIPMEVNKNDKSGKGKEMNSELDYKEMLCIMRQNFLELWSETSQPSSLPPNDLEFFNNIGQGAFGTVDLVKITSKNDFFALKVEGKKDIVDTNGVRHVYNEKNILRSIDHPFIIKLLATFKDSFNIYFMFPLINSGSMFDHLTRLKKFDEKLCKFYAAQIVLTLEYLHYVDVVYRDIKPENILINTDGYLMLIDFGYSKRTTERSYTQCGTPQYMAPEVVLNKEYGRSVDWWGLGILLFEMATGETPFTGSDTPAIFNKILQLDYHCPSYMSNELADIIRNLLQIDERERLGTRSQGVSEVKDHAFFEGINWLDIFKKKMEAPYLPESSVIDWENVKSKGIYISEFCIDYYHNDFKDF